jgi:DNA-binding LacI/PurR family transcriptional regulator
MRITIKDISEICGVSPGTVDRALNNRPGINPKTKAKILETARKLNYRPDHRARSLARGKTMTIGVILFDLRNRSFAQMMNGIERRARELGYFVDLALSGKDPAKEIALIDRLVQRNVDGLILFTVNKGEQFEAYLEHLRLPIVTICNRLSDRWAYVGIDDRQAMKDATLHAIAKGYERIIYICPPLRKRQTINIYTQEERLKGLLAGCEEGNLRHEPIIVQEKNYLDSIKRIDLRNGPRTAILCSTDYYALEVVNMFRQLRIGIPGDVGLVGFDNVDFLKYVNPSLTTIEYAVEEIGERAVDSLVTELETGSRPDIPLLNYRLIEGASL